MLDLSSKIYVQLAPDKPSLAALQALQTRLPLTSKSRVVPASELHLTILHIGLVERLFIAMRRHTVVDDSALLAHVSQLVMNLRSSLIDYSKIIDLRPTGIAYFGSKQNTLVMTLEATPELTVLHHRTLQALQQCFLDCGIINSDIFMRSDNNLVNALTLRPHVTLTKAYEHPVNLPLPNTVSFRVMDIVY